MKVVILAGGYGTRIAEESELKPKPMVEIGGKPILWHIMMHFSHYGFNEFAIALGYKGDSIKRYWSDYCFFDGSMTVNTRTGQIAHHDEVSHPQWIIHLVDTGEKTGTAGRVRRLRHLLNHERFMLTFGDGVSDVDLDKLLAFHESHGKLATVTAVRPPARFGHLEFDGDRVGEFSEKPQTAEGWINGGYFVFEPGFLDYLDVDDATMIEAGPLQELARDGQLMAYRHESFWQCMDTLRDRRRLQQLWKSGDPPWRMWSEHHEGVGNGESGIHWRSADEAA